MQLRQRHLLMTQEGKEEIAAEIAYLERLRQEILAELHGSPDDNARREEVADRRHELAALDREICRLRWELVGGVLVKDRGSLVAVGSEVTVLSGDGEVEFTIVGPAEANPRLGHISYESPLATAVLGCSVGDEVEVTSSEGRRCRLRILAIRPSCRQKVS